MKCGSESPSVVLFDSSINVQFGYLVLHDPKTSLPDFDASFSGQVNGLLGAASPGSLVVFTGTHSGRVSISVVFSAAAPEVTDKWEDVVEASFASSASELSLTSFDDAASFSFPNSGCFRVRLNAVGLDDARENTGGEGDGVDQYLLQIWPSASRLDQIVRVQSRFAANEHEKVEVPVDVEDDDEWEPWSLEEKTYFSRLSTPSQQSVVGILVKISCISTGIDTFALIRQILEAPSFGDDALSNVDQLTTALFELRPVLAGHPDTLTPRPRIQAAVQCIELAARVLARRNNRVPQSDQSDFDLLLELFYETKLACSRTASGDHWVLEEIKRRNHDPGLGE